MVEMSVYKVGIDLQGHTLVLLADADTTRVLPILVGLWEARAIALELERDEVGPPERPMTHDLFVSVIHQLGWELEKITVTKIENGIFYALLSLRNGDRVIEVDARPSDSIAFAVRTGARILVAESVLEEAQVIVEPEDEDDEEGLERFKDLLKDIKLDEPGSDPPEE